MKICAFDLETSISNGPHGPAAKDPSNDFYTIIYGTHPERIKVVHKAEGFKRNLGLHGLIITSSDLLVGHNMPFDLLYIIKEYYLQNVPGIEKPHMPVCWDTQIFQYLISGQRHAFASLAELQEIYLSEKVKDSRISRLYAKGIGADKILAVKDRCKRLFKAYHDYSYQDGATVLKIFKKQYELAKKLKMLPLVMTYNKFMVVLVVMMSNGIKLNSAGIERTIRDFKLKALELLGKAEQLIKPYWNDERLPPFKVLSPQHKSALLFGGTISCKVRKSNGFYKNGKEKFKTFDEDVYIKGFNLDLNYTIESKIKRRYVTDNAVINNIYNSTTNLIAKQYCELQLEAMKYEKMISTYLEAFLRYSVDGYIYPHFNNTAVITGRLSSSQPNFQNIPSKGDFVNEIQGQLIAPEGYICVSIDYSQLEIWIAAWNSGDQQLIKDLENGLDFHCQSLSFAEQMDYTDVYKLCITDKDPEWSAKRTRAKPITFQKEYGAGIKKVAETTGLEVSLVESVFEALDKKYWRLKMFKDFVLETAQKNLKPSHIKYIPTRQRKDSKNGRKFNSYGFELLPIEQNNIRYFDNNLIRNIGYFQTKHGKIYSFEEYATLDKNGNVRRSLSVPQTKNYTSQGGAADIMAAVSIEVMNYCLDNHSDVKYISQIHDSFWFYVKESKRSLIISTLCDIIEDTPSALKKHLNVELAFKFRAEAKVGHDFARMENYDRSEI